MMTGCPIKPRLPGLPGLPGPPDYSRVFYCDPPSHDFCVFLIIAELMRRYHQAPAPLRVKFGLIDDRLGALDFGHLSPHEMKAFPCDATREYFYQMLPNVLRPAMQMIGAVEDAPVYGPFDQPELRGYVEYDYHIHQLVDAARAGFQIPKWVIPDWATRKIEAAFPHRRPVVITLREVAQQPERNSNLPEWVKFAESIKNDYDVIFLRDTCRAWEGLGEFKIAPDASQNIHLRAALYQHALVNLFVGNGPFVWCLFSDSPYLIFKQIIPEIANWAHARPDGWREFDHLEVGDQWPWANQWQRMTWLDDNFDNIRYEFDQFIIDRKIAAAA